MPVPGSSTSSLTHTESELYFLIAKFLAAGPCQRSSKALLEELAENKLLTKRVDWEGREHFRSYENLVELNRHISSEHLLKLCQRVGPLLDKEIPPCITGVRSLLGAGSLSLLRTVEDAAHTRWTSSQLVVLHHTQPVLPPTNLAPISMKHVLDARRLCGTSQKDIILPSVLYSHIKQYDRKLGHLSAVYCISFDVAGRYIFTGADDHLVKIWNSSDCRLLATLRGHSAEITDMAVNFENTLLATGSCDKVIRVWSLKTKAPVAVLHGHTGMITSVQFCPQCKDETRYLASTGADGCVCFWQWNVRTHVFNPKPIKLVERSRAGAQMLCSSFSPGGMFLATGNSDNVIRVYFLHPGAPEKICELEAHKDRVDSMAYSHHGERLMSGSKDGTARIWRYERQDWKALVINTALKADNKPAVEGEPEEKAAKLYVTMVGWSMDDLYVITAVSDHTLKVWNSCTGKLQHVLKGHSDEVFVLEACPTDSRILLSAGHDGHIIIWDLHSGAKLKVFFNMIEGQGHGAVFDCKFSPDGQSFAATDSHGHLLLFGFGTNDKYLKVPKEVFFHTDYRPLIRDANNYVLDEQTQQPPHLMPPPFLVDIDGSPYPPKIQRLVPGREVCTTEQLIPEVAVNEAGDSEVIGEGEQAVDENVNEDVDVVVDDNSVDNAADSETEDEEPVAEEPAAEEPAAEEPVTEEPVSEEPVSEEPDDEEPVDEESATAAQSVAFDAHRPSIDDLIQQLQRDQDNRIARAGGEPLASPPPVGSPPALLSPRGNHSLVGMRRSGELEGVRQSLGNVTQRVTESDIIAMRMQVVIKKTDLSLLRRREEIRLAHGEEENKRFHERRKRSLISNDNSSLSAAQRRRQRGGEPSLAVENEETGRNRLAARALYDTEEEEEDEENMSGSDFLKSDSDSDAYSDWMGDQGSNLQPPVRISKRQRKRKLISSSEVDDDDEDDAGETRTSFPRKRKPPQKKRKKPRRKPKPVINQMEQNQQIHELPDEYRPSEWLTNTIPHKAPYVPQMGDEIIYFRQGHRLYLEAVKKKKTYEVNPNKNQPWHKISDLRDQETVRIIGIRYEIRPPRLCCLKLQFIDHSTSKPTGGSFQIKYHDMADVIDFLVLKQVYDTAMQRNWKPGDRFRSVIDDQWWTGVIYSQEPLHAEYTDSLFQCFNVNWDNGECEKLSPWDMEPVDEQRLSEDPAGGIDVEPDELLSLLYTPKSSEWPPCGRDAEGRRLILGIEAIMQHSIAEPFNAPVDLSAFPAYAMIIEYPIDLSTIKDRLEHNFYRRVAALQSDVRRIESNTTRFNEPGTPIVRSACIVSECLLRFIKDTECDDPMPIVTELTQGESFNWGPNQSTDDSEDSTTRKRKKTQGNNTGNKRRKMDDSVDADAWRDQCWAVFNQLIECHDAEPFRRPVDPEEIPEYYQCIDAPMDFSIIQDNLNNNYYDEPAEFCRDIRLIFQNSKAFNTNKRSRIYAMTLRLSAMFEEKVKDIMVNWKRVQGLTENNKTSQKRYGTSSTSRPHQRSTNHSSSIQASSSSTSRSTRSRVTDRLTNGHSTENHQLRPRRNIHLRNTRRRMIEEEEVEVTKEKAGPEKVADSSDTEDESSSSSDGSSTDSSADKVAVNKDNHDEDSDNRDRRKAKGKLAKKTQKHSGKSSLTNGNSEVSYRTRASTGKIKPRHYNEDEDENISISKAKSSSSSTRSSDSDSSASTANSDNSDDEKTEHYSDYEEQTPRIFRTKKPISKVKSIQRQVESVRHRGKRKPQTSGDSGSVLKNPNRTTRNQGRRTVRYQEDSDVEKSVRLRGESDDSSSDSDVDIDEKIVSRSSRGRIRKLTPRARANLLGE